MSKASDEFQHPPRSKKDFTEDGEGSTKKRETKRRRVTEKASDKKEVEAKTEGVEPA